MGYPNSENECMNYFPSDRTGARDVRNQTYNIFVKKKKNAACLHWSVKTVLDRTGPQVVR